MADLFFWLFLIFVGWIVSLFDQEVQYDLNIYAHAVQKSNVKALNLMADLLNKNPNNEQNNEHEYFQAKRKPYKWLC